jgi:hypothetical protein
MMAFTWQSSMDVAKSCLSFADKVNRPQNMMLDSLLNPARSIRFPQQVRSSNRASGHHMLSLGILSPDAEA